MKNFLVLCLGLATVAGAAFANTNDWQLVWSDEFEKPGLPDASKWAYEQGWLRNNELQYYTRERQENARVENGMLIIEGRQEKFPNPNYQAGAQGSRRSRQFADYTSASLHTRGIAAWKYGRIEARAKIPQGRGVWPAFWMLGTTRGVGWPACGELDIMEYVGFEPDTIHGTIHCGKYNHVKGTQKGSTIKVEAPYRDFHVYALEWDAEKIDILVDEKKYFTFKNEHSGVEAWPFDNPHYVILNLAIGGAWDGAKGIDISIFPQKYCIDYVRVYQKKPGADASKP